MSDDLLRPARQLLDELDATTVYLRVAASQSLSYAGVLRVERRAAQRCTQLLALAGGRAFELPQDDATDELLAGDVRLRDPAFVRQTTASQLYTSEPLTGPGLRPVRGVGRYEPFDDGPEGAADETADLRSEESVPIDPTPSQDLITLPPIDLPSAEIEEVEDDDTNEVLRQAERMHSLAATPLTETRTPGPPPRHEPSYVTFDPTPVAEGLPEEGLEELELDEASSEGEGPDTFDLVPDNDDTEPAVVARRPPAPAVTRAPIGASVSLRDPDERIRPRAAAIQLNPSGAGGKVLGLEEEEEPIEVGAAEDDDEGGEMDLTEGFSVSMQPAEELELEQEDDGDESEESESDEPEPLPAVAPPKPTKEEVDAILSKARQSATEGRLQQGADLFSDVIDADPDNVDAHVARGRLYLDLGDYSRAMSDFMVAEDIAPNSPEPQVAIGDLYFARKDYRKAIDYFNAALEVAPNHAMAYCRRGISHYYRKNFREAVDDLLQAEKLDADIPNIQTYVAMARKKVKK